MGLLAGGVQLVLAIVWGIKQVLVFLLEDVQCWCIRMLLFDWLLLEVLGRVEGITGMKLLVGSGLSIAVEHASFLAG